MGDSEARPVLGPGDNKAQRLIDVRKPILNPLKKAEKSAEEVEAVEDKNVLLPLINLAKSSPRSHSKSVPSILGQHESLLSCNLSLNASCSSDASSGSFHSRASTVGTCRTKSSKSSQKKLLAASKARNGVVLESLPQGVQAKRRCAWVTPSTGSYSNFLSSLGL